jgi:hypothetical protein
VRGPHAKTGFPGLFEAVPPPGLRTRALAATPPSCAVAETLAFAAAFDSSPLPPFCRREAAQELRQEVSFTPVSCIVELGHRSALVTSPDYPSRAAALSACAAASPPQPPSLVAPPPHALHVGVFRAPNRALKP